MAVPVLTEAALAAVAKAVLGHLAAQGAKAVVPEDRVRAWLGRDPQRLAMQVALADALARFADRHPGWVASLFDEHFLAHRAAPILARCLSATDRPEPVELAAAWAGQFGPARAAAAPHGELTAAAADFLREFEAALRDRAEFRPLYDSRALDALSRSAAAGTRELEALRHELGAALERLGARTGVEITHGAGVLVGAGGTQVNIFQTFAAAPEWLAARIRAYEFRTLIEERTRGFVGREFVFRAVEGHLRRPEFPSGYVVIRGEPGIGKTAILGELVKRHGYPHHFNIAPQGIRSVEEFLGNTCAQLIVRYRLPHASLPPAATRTSAFLSQLLAEAADRRGADPVVVLVDALDEAEDRALPETANRLYLPPSLPPGVFFVVSTREQVDYRLKVDRREDIYLADDDPRNTDDVRRYVADFVREHEPVMRRRFAEWQATEREFVDAMTERSQGNFMYLVYMLPDIRDGQVTVADVRGFHKLPLGLLEYYRNHWRQLEVEDEALFDRRHKPVVLLLAAAREPVTVRQLVEWTRLDAMAVNKVLARWRPFLNEDADERGEPRYRIYHASFQDFLREDIGLVETHGVIAQAALDKIPGLGSEA